jgi:hypothetical protein
MALSAPSRITSYSISFQPSSERSTKIWERIESSSPRAPISSSSSGVRAIPPPVPPSV